MEAQLNHPQDVDFSDAKFQTNAATQPPARWWTYLDDRNRRMWHVRPRENARWAGYACIWL
jgi:hypothetical protein